MISYRVQSFYETSFHVSFYPESFDLALIGFSLLTFSPASLFLWFIRSLVHQLVRNALIMKTAGLLSLMLLCFIISYVHSIRSSSFQDGNKGCDGLFCPLKCFESGFVNLENGTIPINIDDCRSSYEPLTCIKSIGLRILPADPGCFNDCLLWLITDVYVARKVGGGEYEERTLILQTLSEEYDFMQIPISACLAKDETIVVNLRWFSTQSGCLNGNAPSCVNQIYSISVETASPFCDDSRCPVCPVLDPWRSKTSILA